MLRPPHDRYDRLFVYHFDRLLPAPDQDQDLIGAWVEDGKSILFFHQAKAELVAALCRAHRAELVYQADLDYLDWEAGVAIEPFATRLLRVRPLWFPPQADEEHCIVLDPSVIFGSGFHATTRICLEALENLAPEPEARIETVLDLGTGTGILAIAAASLGARTVEAVDLNPLSIAVARRNVELNGQVERVTVLPGDLEQRLPDTRRDLIIANLYKGLLLKLFDRPDFWRGRFYLISGFIPAMEADLLAALPMRRLRLLERRQREQWRLWVLENTAFEEGRD